MPKTSQPGSPIEGLAQIPPRPPALDDADRDRLLALTRIALEYATLAGGSDRRPGPGRGSETPWQRLDAALEAATNIGEPAAVFVTLTEYDDLRGCMGNLDRATPLAESVVAAAVTVARHDPRFLPVAPRELPAIHVEISVLGEAVPLVSPEDFEPGVDGVIVECGGRRALLLPEVATDQGWGTTEMFDTVCRKAGLPRDAWRDPGARLLRFRTIRFGGPAVEGAPDL